MQRVVGAGQVEVEDHGLLVELCLDLGPRVQHLGSSGAPQRQGMTPKETVTRLLELSAPAPCLICDTPW